MVFDKGFKEKLEGEQGQKIRFLWMERQTPLIKGDLHASSQVPRNVDATVHTVMLSLVITATGLANSKL